MRPFNPNPVNSLGGFRVGDRIEFSSLSRFYGKWPEAYEHFGIDENVRSRSEEVDCDEEGQVMHLFPHPKYPDRNVAVVDLDDGGYCVINVKSLTVLGREFTPEPTEVRTGKEGVVRVDVSFARKSSKSRLLNLSAKRESKVNL